jgi:hypothetical protein
MIVSLALGLLGTTACGDDGGGDGSFDARRATCDERLAAWPTVVAELDRRCGGHGDCELIGGPLDVNPTCNCMPWLPPAAVARGSNRSAAYDLFETYRTECASTGPRICDAAPPLLECIDGSCRLTERSCLDPLAESGE